MSERVSVQALRELAEKAAPGPWHVEDDGGIPSGWVFPHGAYSSSAADNEFIAACDPQTVQALLGVVECALIFVNADNADRGIEGYFKALGEALKKVEL